MAILPVTWNEALNQKLSESQTGAGNLKSLKTWQPEHLKTLKTLKMILETCWTTFVFMSMLKGKFLSGCQVWFLRHPEQLLFSCLCSKVTLTLSHSFSLSHSLSLTLSLTLTVSHSLPLVILNNFCFRVYAQKSLSHSHTISLSQCLTLTHPLFLSLIHSLSTCWTTFVFMSMLKSRCLLPKIAMFFLGHQQPHHPLLWV